MDKSCGVFMGTAVDGSFRVSVGFPFLEAGTSFGGSIYFLFKDLSLKVDDSSGHYYVVPWRVRGLVSSFSSIHFYRRSYS